MSTPTIERIRKDKAGYQPPETTQTTKREYARFRHWYETMEAKGSITPEQAMAARYDAIADLVKSADFVEGPRAFAEKRKPRWTGN